MREGRTAPAVAAAHADAPKKSMSRAPRFQVTCVPRYSATRCRICVCPWVGLRGGGG